MERLHELKLQIMSKIVHLFPAPKDENGNHIVFVQNGKGEIVEWPKKADGESMSFDELEEWQEATK